jgi:hypothetical protein
MSNALAISGVTAVLEYLLTNTYAGAQLGAVTVSAIAPDLVQAGSASGSDSALQVNLFMHQVTYNAAWRNVGQPSVAPDGSTRLSNPPLALDLHYLLTAYASEDCQAEALLGFAIQLMHEMPVIPRDQIALGLGALPGSNIICDLLAASGLADQIEMIKLTPATLGREELAWLWTALKADYRPTFPFQVSVVLIEPQFPTLSELPVLSRNIMVQAGPKPQLWQVVPPAGQSTAAVGDTVTVTGTSLAGVNLVALSNPRLSIEYSLKPAGVTDSAVTFVVPNVPPDDPNKSPPFHPKKLPAGVYSLSVLLTGVGKQIIQSSDPIPIAIAPLISTASAPVVATNTEGFLVTVNCQPEVSPNQSVTLALGATMVPALIFDAPLTSVLQFQFPSTLARGPQLARLCVDGVESPVKVNWSALPNPLFTGPMVTV